MERRYEKLMMSYKKHLRKQSAKDANSHTRTIPYKQRNGYRR